MTTMSVLTEEPPEAELPLLVDTGVITETPVVGVITLAAPASEDDLKRTIQFWVRLITAVGCLFGIVSPLLAIVATLNIAYISGSPSSFPVPLVWCAVLAIFVAGGHCFCHQILLRRARSQGVAEVSVKLLKLRFTLGTLSGILVSWAATCMLLGFQLWDQLGLMFEAAAVLLYFGSSAVHLKEEDYQIKQGDENGVEASPV